MKTKDRFSVYVIEDDNLFARTLKHYLDICFRNHPTDVQLFRTGEECLKSFRNHAPDIVVIDYHINEAGEHVMHYDQVIELIRNTHSNAEIVILAEKDQLKIAADTIRHGAVAYLVKSETAMLQLQNIIINSRKSRER